MSEGVDLMKQDLLSARRGGLLDDWQGLRYIVWPSQ